MSEAETVRKLIAKALAEAARRLRERADNAESWARAAATCGCMGLEQDHRLDAQNYRTAADEIEQLSGNR